MGMGHPSNVVARARELSEAGFKPGKIVKLLDSELGVAVAEVTVRRWVDLDYAERQKESRRTHARRLAAGAGSADCGGSASCTPRSVSR